MEETKNNRIQDELLGQVSGGNDAQYAEIMDYIAIHDPAAYAVIQSKPERWRVSYAMRYLYDHGVPVVMTTDSLGDNVYSKRENKPSIAPLGFTAWVVMNRAFSFE